MMLNKYFCKLDEILPIKEVAINLIYKLEYISVFDKSTFNYDNRKLVYQMFLALFKKEWTKPEDYLESFHPKADNSYVRICLYHFYEIWEQSNQDSLDFKKLVLPESTSNLSRTLDIDALYYLDCLTYSLFQICFYLQRMDEKGKNISECIQSMFPIHNKMENGERYMEHFEISEEIDGDYVVSKEILMQSILTTTKRNSLKFLRLIGNEISLKGKGLSEEEFIQMRKSMSYLMFKFV